MCERCHSDSLNVHEFIDFISKEKLSHHKNHQQEIYQYHYILECRWFDSDLIHDHRLNYTCLISIRLPRVVSGFTWH